MNEKMLFELIKKVIPDLETSSEFSYYDCYSKKYQFHIELKCREKHYTKLVIEKIKYDKLKLIKSKYINSTPEGIYSFSIQDLNEPIWEEWFMPKTSKFEDTNFILKKVGFMDINLAKNITNIIK